MKHSILYLVASLLSLGACTLHEEPQLTADGELGVDPTTVTLNAELQLDLNLPERSESSATRAAAEGYLQRFTVVAYLDRQPVARQQFVESICERTHLSLPVSMKLHARSYQLAVWSDYVSAADPEADLYYNTESLVPLIPNRSTHVGNTEMKDAFAATTQVDLSAYRDQWNVQVPVSIELTRPVARYELIATDVASFLYRVQSGVIEGTKFTARLKYDGYRPVGYNVLDDVLKHSLMYMQYQKSFSLPAEGTKELTLAFDYLFVPRDAEATEVPAELEIVDQNNVTVANTVLRIPLLRGQNTTLHGPFLTQKSTGGVGIDPGYDGEINVDLGPI